MYFLEPVWCHIYFDAFHTPEPWKDNSPSVYFDVIEGSFG